METRSRLSWGVRLLQDNRAGTTVARSRKRVPIAGITSATSEKQEKRANHQRERRLVRQMLATDPEPDLLPHTRELSDPWSMSKDGKIYLGPWTRPEDLRK